MSLSIVVDNVLMYVVFNRHRLINHSVAYVAVCISVLMFKR